MRTNPAINQAFIHDINSKRPFKRATRLLADQIRATDFQTTKIEKSAIQQHRDQVALQKQQDMQHKAIIQLLLKHQEEMTQKLEAVYQVLEKILVANSTLSPSKEKAVLASENSKSVSKKDEK